MSISPLALVSPAAIVGEDVEIGPWTLVHENAVIGDRAVIESHCVIGKPTGLAHGKPLVIGPNALIRSHSIFYQGSEFGAGLSTGHRVTVREGLTAGDGLQIGTLCDLQGDAVIGHYVRAHSGVFVAKYSTIGNFVWLLPGVVLTNDPRPPSDVGQAGPTIEDYAVVAARACILPGVRIGARSLVAAGSLVTKDVAPDTIVAGTPARNKGLTSSITLRDGSGEPAYPWMRRFHRGYPDDVIDGWDTEHARDIVTDA